MTNDAATAVTSETNAKSSGDSKPKGSAEGGSRGSKGAILGKRNRSETMEEGEI